MYSVDGINWTSTSNGTPTTYWYGSTYGAGKFVAVGANQSSNELAMWSYTGGSDDAVLTFANDNKLALFADGDSIKQDDNAASGAVAILDVAAKTIQVAGSTGTWSANTGNYVIGPRTPSIADSTLYASLDSSLNVVNLQSTDPGYTTFSGIQPKVQFPAVLPDGQTPDATLLDGTQIKTTVQADNLAFPADTKDSNTLTPGSTRSGGFDLNDPAQVAEFQVVKDSLESYEQERDTRRSNFAQAMRDANFSEDEIKSVGLE